MYASIYYVTLSLNPFPRERDLLSPLCGSKCCNLYVIDLAHCHHNQGTVISTTCSAISTKRTAVSAGHTVISTERTAVSAGHTVISTEHSERRDLINEFPEFRPDDQLLMVTLLYPSYNLSIDTEAL